MENSEVKTILELALAMWTDPPSLIDQIKIDLEKGTNIQPAYFENHGKKLITYFSHCLESKKISNNLCALIFTSGIYVQLLIKNPERVIKILDNVYQQNHEQILPIVQNLYISREDFDEMQKVFFALANIHHPELLTKENKNELVAFFLKNPMLKKTLDETYNSHFCNKNLSSTENAILKEKLSEIKESGAQLLQLLEKISNEEVISKKTLLFLLDLENFFGGKNIETLEASNTCSKLSNVSPDSPKFSLLLKKEWISFLADELSKSSILKSLGDPRSIENEDIRNALNLALAMKNDAKELIDQVKEDLEKGMVISPFYFDLKEGERVLTYFPHYLKLNKIPQELCSHIFTSKAYRILTLSNDKYCERLIETLNGIYKQNYKEILPIIQKINLFKADFDGMARIFLALAHIHNPNLLNGQDRDAVSKLLLEHPPIRNLLYKVCQLPVEEFSSSKELQSKVDEIRDSGGKLLQFLERFRKEKQVPQIENVSKAISLFLFDLEKSVKDKISRSNFNLSLIRKEWICFVANELYESILKPHSSFSFGDLKLIENAEIQTALSLAMAMRIDSPALIDRVKEDLGKGIDAQPAYFNSNESDMTVTYFPYYLKLEELPKEIAALIFTSLNYQDLILSSNDKFPEKLAETLNTVYLGNQKILPFIQELTSENINLNEIAKTFLALANIWHPKLLSYKDKDRISKLFAEHPSIKNSLEKIYKSSSLTLLKENLNEIKESGNQLFEFLERFDRESVREASQEILLFLLDLDSFSKEKNIKELEKSIHFLSLKNVPQDSSNFPLILRKEWICFVADKFYQLISSNSLNFGDPRLIKNEEIRIALSLAMAMKADPSALIDRVKEDLEKGFNCIEPSYFSFKKEHNKKGSIEKENILVTYFPNYLESKELIQKISALVFTSNEYRDLILSLEPTQCEKLIEILNSVYLNNYENILKSIKELYHIKRSSEVAKIFLTLAAVYHPELLSYEDKKISSKFLVEHPNLRNSLYKILKSHSFYEKEIKEKINQIIESGDQLLQFLAQFRENKSLVSYVEDISQRIALVLLDLEPALRGKGIETLETLNPFSRLKASLQNSPEFFLLLRKEWISFLADHLHKLILLSPSSFSNLQNLGNKEIQIALNLAIAMRIDPPDLINQVKEDLEIGIDVQPTYFKSEAGEIIMTYFPHYIKLSKRACNLIFQSPNYQCLSLSSDYKYFGKLVEILNDIYLEHYQTILPIIQERDSLQKTEMVKIFLALANIHHPERLTSEEQNQLSDFFIDYPRIKNLLAEFSSSYK